MSSFPQVIEIEIIVHLFFLYFDTLKSCVYFTLRAHHSSDEPLFKRWTQIHSGHCIGQRKRFYQSRNFSWTVLLQGVLILQIPPQSLAEHSSNCTGQAILYSYSSTPTLLLILTCPHCSVQSLSRVRFFATPWIAARQAFLSITNSRSSPRLNVHRVSDTIQPSHPLSSPFPPAPNPSQHQGLFQWVNSSHEVAKVLEFQL